MILLEDFGKNSDGHLDVETLNWKGLLWNLPLASSSETCSIISNWILDTLFYFNWDLFIQNTNMAFKSLEVSLIEPSTYFKNKEDNLVFMYSAF